jgi:hypothetical protein
MSVFSSPGGERKNDEAELCFSFTDKIADFERIKAKSLLK